MVSFTGLGSSSNRSSSSTWGAQRPYLQDIYAQAANMFHGGGMGMGNNPANATMLPGGTPGGTPMGGAAPGMRGTTPGAPAMGAPDPRIASIENRLADPNIEFMERMRLTRELDGLRSATPAAATSPAPGIPPGEFGQAPGMAANPGFAGANQAFNSLVNATDPTSNPYFQDSVTAALRPMFDQYVNRIAPGADMAAVLSGQAPDSSRNQIERGLAQQGLFNAAGDVVANMGSQAYGQGLQAAESALTNNPYGATMWDLLDRYRQSIGDPVQHSSGRGSGWNVGYGRPG